MSCEELFLKQLHQRGFRLTPQRELILVVLHQIGHPASAEEIYKLVAEKTGSVELSTVYRTLDLLNSMNMVTLIDLGEKRLFELTGIPAPHLHLVCRSCGNITGLELDLIQPLLDHLQEKIHFTPDLGSITITGLCEDCKKAELSSMVVGESSLRPVS